jgi:hypothetical protein
MMNGKSEYNEEGPAWTNTGGLLHPWPVAIGPTANVRPGNWLRVDARHGECLVARSRLQVDQVFIQPYAQDAADDVPSLMNIVLVDTTGLKATKLHFPRSFRDQLERHLPATTASEVLIYLVRRAGIPALHQIDFRTATPRTSALSL